MTTALTPTMITHPLTRHPVTLGGHVGNVHRLGNGEYVISIKNSGFALEDEGKWVCLVDGDMQGNSRPYATEAEAEQEAESWREAYPEEARDITVTQIQADWGQRARR
jgi:hypothetical protein